MVTDELVASLDAADDVTVVVGALTPELEEAIRDRVPDATVFTSDLPWLHATADGEDGEPSIGRILLIDRNTIMVSSVEDSTGKERAVFSRGVGNGLVVIARRVMATGLVPAEDPGNS